MAVEGLFDTATFQDWQTARFDTASSDLDEDHEILYENLRTEASALYYKLLDRVQDLPVSNRVRLFRYLQGDSICDIGEIEDVTRQAVHKCLQLTIRNLGVDVKRVRLVWIWGQTTFSSTAITHLS